MLWLAWLVFVLTQAVPACPAEGVLSSPYGRRIDPITERRSWHGGVDVANVEGTPIRAPWAGKVSMAWKHKTSGRFVTLHTGPYRLTFMHLSESKVRTGDYVARGQVIGLMGQTGRATGPHLHLELRKWGKRKRIDPTFILTMCDHLAVDDAGSIVKLP